MFFPGKWRMKEREKEEDEEDNFQCSDFRRPDSGRLLFDFYCSTFIGIVQLLSTFRC